MADRAPRRESGTPLSAALSGIERERVIGQAAEQHGTHGRDSGRVEASLLTAAALLLSSTSASVAPVSVRAQEITVPDSTLVVGRRVDPEAVPRPSAHALRVTGPITVDGRLDEAAWREAEPITGFFQSKPNTGYPATARTVAWVLYDNENLYVGAKLYDSDPEEITVHSLRREFPSRDGDILGIAIDTYLDRRNGFLFAVNPKGALIDLQAFDNGRDMNFAWEGVVSRAARVHEDGWTVEIAIPFTTLRFDPT